MWHIQQCTLVWSWRSMWSDMWKKKDREREQNLSPVNSSQLSHLFCLDILLYSSEKKILLSQHPTSNRQDGKNQVCESGTTSKTRTRKLSLRPNFDQTSCWSLKHLEEEEEEGKGSIITSYYLSLVVNAKYFLLPTSEENRRSLWDERQKCLCVRLLQLPYA